MQLLIAQLEPDHLVLERRSRYSLHPEDRGVEANDGLRLVVRRAEVPRRSLGQRAARGREIPLDLPDRQVGRASLLVARPFEAPHGDDRRLRGSLLRRRHVYSGSR